MAEEEEKPEEKKPSTQPAAAEPVQEGEKSNKELERERKQEFGGLRAEALTSRKARKELEEREREERLAEKIELRKTKVPLDPTYFRRKEEKRKELREEREEKEREKVKVEEPAEEESEELTKEEMEAGEIRKMGALFSPEALVMFMVAGSLDLAGLVIFILSLFGIGIAISFIPDIIGLVFLGSLMYFRTGHVTISRSAGKTIRKSGRKILKRLGLAFLGELIPFFGDIAFCWTLAVYFELKNN